MSDSTFVFGLIGVAAVLMASNRVRFDVVALLVVIALILSGTLSVGAALSGFGSSVVILVGGLLIVGEMLDRTGVARAVGDWILKHGGGSEIQLLALIMVSAGLLGSAMSSTAVVAIFIPIVLRIAAETGIASSKILIPMSYAALISGMTTLIASPPNLVVNAELIANGHEGLGFFSFSLLGLAVLGVAVIYILTIGRHLLRSEADEKSSPQRQRTFRDLWKDFRLNDNVAVFIVTAESSLAGRTIEDAALESNYGVRVLTRARRNHRGQESVAIASSGMELHAGDVLFGSGHTEALERLIREQNLDQVRDFEERLQRWAWELGMATILIHPESSLIGQSVTDSAFRTHYGLQVIGVRQGGEGIAEFEDNKLAAGDMLLLHGPWSKIDALRGANHDFVLVDIPPEHEEVVPAYTKAPVALAILAAMVLLSVLDVMPLVVCVLGAAIAAVVSGCLSAEQAYRSVHWSSLVLVAGMLPLADALQQTGGSALIVDSLLGAFGDAGPGVMLTIMFALTALLGLVLSNTASAVLVAPIAITAAQTLQVSPYPFAIAVLIAASAAFSTPVSTPVVTLVVDPGRYSFMDFVKVGVPLLFLTWLVTLLVAPLLFPY